MQRPLLCTAVAVLVVLTACTTQQSQPQPLPDAPTNAVIEKEKAARQIVERREAKDERVDQAASISRQNLEAEVDAMAPSPSLASGAVSKMMAMPSPSYAPPVCCNQPVEDRENYAQIASNPIQRVAENPVSTFSIDVDTGSYANVRRFLKQGRLPPQDAVRVEEMVNYFDYAYAPPRNTEVPFSVVTEIAPTPWNKKTQLLHVGIQGWKPQGPRVASNLIFLVDVSGSMNEPNKLPLVKSALKLLTKDLTRDDRISLVVYAGNSGVVLEPTPGNQSAKIEDALDRLEAGGSTNGGAGIQQAYALARQAFIKNGNNRVLLATDGDFNVGTTNFERLIDLVEEQRKTGIALTTLGFGEGNYNDKLMEQLADAGNGNYAYIDTLSEAQKVLVDQRDATLRTIARDVKIQIEFNPSVVSEYRLIGYENRMLRREDFNNDKIDAGEIGAGHTVTALYEITLANDGGRIDPLRYGGDKIVKSAGDELAFLRLRYKRPEDGMSAASRLIERPLRAQDVKHDLAQTSDAFRLSAAVAGFGQLLRGGNYTESFHYTDVEKLARGARGQDAHGYAGEFLQLVQLAGSLSTKQARAETMED